MNNTFRQLLPDFLHLFFPHLCAGCGSDLLKKDQSICIQCYTSLPETNFAATPANPIEQLFYGRLRVQEAMSAYYFTKHSVLQNMIHAFKYTGHKECGRQLGKWMGLQLQQSKRFRHIDYLVPMPLYPERFHRRGYNQATLLCEGMATVTEIPIHEQLVARIKPTATQTKKGRTERWKNVSDSFALIQDSSIANQHLLLVDDVITTGASLEACGTRLSELPGIKLSIATLAFSTDD
jgi:ComF family protein